MVIAIPPLAAQMVSRSPMLRKPVGRLCSSSFNRFSRNPHTVMYASVGSALSSTVFRFCSSHVFPEAGMYGTRDSRKTKNGKIAKSHAYASADAHMKTLSSPHCCQTRLHRPMKPMRLKTGERSRMRAMRPNVTRRSRKLPAPPQHPLDAKGQKDQAG